MARRQKQASVRDNPSNSASYSAPDVVSKPKTDKVRKHDELEASRESTITNLELIYLDPIIGNRQRGIPAMKISGRDLAVINRPDLFKDVEPKPDRRKNRAVDYMIHHLKFLHFLLEHFNTTYRKKIWDSPEFQSLIKKYLGTAEYTKVKLSPDEKTDRLRYANQSLMESLTIIEDNLPPKFKEALKETGKPYFKLIEAIADFTGKEISIPDRMRR